MRKKSLGWVLEFTGKLPNEEEKIKCLQANDNGALRTILRFAFDPNIKWLLPEGDPPYTTCPFPDQENTLYMEARKLYLFVDGGNPNLSQLRREKLWIDLLESVDPLDAKLLLSIKDKKIPGLTTKIVKRAFPEL